MVAETKREGWGWEATCQLAEGSRSLTISKTGLNRKIAFIYIQDL